jgi:hypothetical protein
MNNPLCSPPLSCLRQLIEITTQTLDRRSCQFRNTIIAVVVTVAASVIAAIIARSCRPLSGLLLLPIVVNAFILLDGRVLGVWRSKILNSWVNGEIDLELFVRNINSIKVLPKKTIGGMLGLLPGQNISAVKEAVGFRGAVADTLTAMNRHQMLRSGAVFCATVFLFIPIAAALLTRSFRPLYGIGLIAVVFVVWPFMVRQIWRRWLRRLVRLFSQGSPEREKFERGISSLDWDSIGEKWKERAMHLLRRAS